MITQRQHRGIARLVVVLASGVALGLTIADRVEQPRWLNVAGAIILLMFVVAAYELCVASLTWALGRTLRGPTGGSEVSADFPLALSQRRWEQLRAPQALALLGAYLAGQVLAWFVLAILAGFRVDGGVGSPALQQEVLRLAPAGILLSIIAGAASALLLYRRKVGRSAIATAGEELGWGPTKPPDLALGLASGLVVAVINLLGAPLLAEPPRLSDLGLLSQLVSAGGLARAAWAVAAVVLAPPVEEFVFRGALFSGLARSLGRVAAVVLTTVIFALLHLPVVVMYWPAAAAITLLGLTTGMLRARTGRIGPCIVAHCVYNLMIVLAAYGIGIPVGSG